MQARLRSAHEVFAHLSLAFRLESLFDLLGASAVVSSKVIEVIGVSSSEMTSDADGEVRAVRIGRPGVGSIWEDDVPDAGFGVGVALKYMIRIQPSKRKNEQ